MRRWIYALVLIGACTAEADTTELNRKLLNAYWTSVMHNGATQRVELQGNLNIIRDMASEAYVEISDSLAYAIAVAVHRDSQLTGLPASFYFGLMRVENPQLDPLIVNDYGAVGLTQVVPRFWMGEFPECGEDLMKNVYTQICYGARVYLYYFSVWEDETLALYAYNGCTLYLRNIGNRCRDFPSWVQDFTMRYDSTLEYESNND